MVGGIGLTERCRIVLMTPETWRRQGESRRWRHPGAVRPIVAGCLAAREHETALRAIPSSRGARASEPRRANGPVPPWRPPPASSPQDNGIGRAALPPARRKEEIDALAHIGRHLLPQRRGVLAEQAADEHGEQHEV